MWCLVLIFFTCSGNWNVESYLSHFFQDNKILPVELGCFLKTFVIYFFIAVLVCYDYCQSFAIVNGTF